MTRTIAQVRFQIFVTAPANERRNAEDTERSRGHRELPHRGSTRNAGWPTKAQLVTDPMPQRGATGAESLEPRITRMGAKTAEMGRLGLRPPAALRVAGRSRGGSAVLREPADPPRERRRKNFRSPFARPKGDSRHSRLAFMAVPSGFLPWLHCLPRPALFSVSSVVFCVLCVPTLLVIRPTGFYFGCEAP